MTVFSKKEFEIDSSFEDKALQWAALHPFAAFLNPNHHNDYLHGGFKKLLAVGKPPESLTENKNLEFLKTKHLEDWWFGYIGYGLQGTEASRKSTLPDPLGFPEVSFFKADIVVEWVSPGHICIAAQNPDSIFQTIDNQRHESASFHHTGRIVSQTPKNRYLEDVEQIQECIRQGTFYEINLCQYFETTQAVNGLQAYRELNRLSPMPFSAWYKAGTLEIACASPERYLKKQGQTLISQPIKGSAKRDVNPEKDRQIAYDLLHSEKERAENLMIVDLVRNDLARVSETGSVQVEALFTIYSLPLIHQMVSTIRSTLRGDVGWTEAIRYSFPMGSMTGAPKQEVMAWIDRLETQKRGAFSGALGYIAPGNDFDFNVLIRSLFINHALNKTGFGVGSAITIDSDGEEEWQECMAKAAAIFSLFGEKPG